MANTTAKAADVRVVKQGDGKPLWFLGCLFEIKATGADTGGRFTAIEMTVGPRLQGAPPHTHDYGETVRVLEGRIRYHVDDRDHDLGPGDLIFLPAGCRECFENPTDQPAKLFVIYDKPGMEDFFAAVGQPAPRRELPPPPEGPPDLAKVAREAEKVGTHIEVPQSGQG